MQYKITPKAGDAFIISASHHELKSGVHLFYKEAARGEFVLNEIIKDIEEVQPATHKPFTPFMIKPQKD